RKKQISRTLSHIEYCNTINCLKNFSGIITLNKDFYSRMRIDYNYTEYLQGIDGKLSQNKTNPPIIKFHYIMIIIRH
ncbi:MAG: hypothetical protein ACI90V_006530, partial [Bacillariaceae sp.]